MTARVEYIARLTCACGATVEMPVSISTYDCENYKCRPELEHDNPDGWLGGFDDANPIECPACVERRYA